MLFYCVARVAVAIVKKLICRNSANAFVLSLVCVVEHIFQVPIPNSPLFFNYAWALVFARVKVNHRRVYSCILAKCMLLPWQRGCLKTRLKEWFLCM